MDTQKLPKPLINSSSSDPEKPLDNTQYQNYLNTQQASQYLQVSTQWLEINRCKGGGPPYIKLSRLVRYKRGDLDEWMIKHRRFNTLESKVGVEK